MVGTIRANGLPRLHIVARTGSIETIRAMVECGANINAGDEWGATPLMSLADACPELDRQVAGYLDYQERLQQRAKEQPERARK